MRVDPDAIRAVLRVSDVVGRYVHLKKTGPAEYKGLCPFHEERTPSFTVNDEKHLFCCFGCDAKGDQFEFLMRREGWTFQQAAAELQRAAGGTPSAPGPAPAPTAGKAKKESGAPTPVLPVPASAPPASFRHPRHGEASRTWTYRDGTGQLLGYVCRFDVNGHKEVLPRCYTAEKGWAWVSFPKPRPLYRLDALAAAPAGANVVIAEGEKATDAAQELFPGAVAVGWPGGGKAVKHADWSPLRGRKVVIWPDWDLQPYPSNHAQAGEIIPPLEQPGMKTAIELAAILGGLGCQVRIAWPPDVQTNGWDAADALADGWTPERAREWLRAALRDPAQLQPQQQLIQEEPPPHGDPPPGGPDMGEPGPDHDPDRPFQCLGHDHGDYYYLARGAKQVLRLSGAGHTKAGLLTLASLTYWEREFPSKGGANWDLAANALIRMSERAGVYDPMRVRGRGAWWDDGDPVLHLGDRLVVAGQERDVTTPRGRFIYEAAPPLRVQTANPLKPAEAIQLVEMTKLLSWEKPIHALLLAGWCVVAPICGALRWRPHVWITGPAGSGKSWIYENILVRCLGDIALAAASETTEAGLRQVLGTDARPVVFDEAEGETGKAQQRIQNVLALMRQASSETSAAIYKGTSSGEGQRYITRSCFAFSSIGVGLQQHADQTRVTVLPLTIDIRKTKEERSAHFSQVVEPKWLATLTPEFVDRLHARTVSLIPVIRKNAETFAVAGASVIGTRRLGDQLGALLAGVFSLYSSKAITLDEAKDWLLKQDWTDETQLQEQKDEVSCLQHILQHVVSVQTDRGRHDRNLAELVRAVTGMADLHVPPDDAHDTLKRNGLRVDGGELLVANNHTALAKVLANTPWAKNWKLILRRLPGAHTTDARRFGGAAPDRSVAIPISVVFYGEAPEPEQQALGVA